ncbi:MAG: TetR/AcrR family transcriptional regulator [Hyphomonadaceae bacterium]
MTPPDGVALKRAQPVEASKAEIARAEITKGNRSRQRIVLAARDLFKREDFHSVSLRNIAAAAEIKLGGLYFHFQTKDAIVLAVLRMAMEDATANFHRAVAAAGPNASALARLEAALRAHAAFVTEQNLVASLAKLRPVDRAVWDEHLVDQRAYADLFAGLIAELRAEGALRADMDDSILRMLILGALNWSSEWRRQDGPRSLDAIVDDLMRIVTGGALAAPSAGDDLIAKRPLRYRADAKGASKED